MDVFPFQFLLVLRFTLIGPVAYGEDAEAVEVVGDAEDTTDDIIGGGAIVETATTHLNPARTQTKLLGLILHGDGCDRTILDPTVILHRIAQNGNSHRGALKELAAHVLGIAEFLDIHWIIDHHKLPSTLALRRGRHQGCTEYELEVLGVDLLTGELAMAAAHLRQIFEISHNCYKFLCKDNEYLARIARINTKIILNSLKIREIRVIRALKCLSLHCERTNNHHLHQVRGDAGTAQG